MKFLNFFLFFVLGFFSLLDPDPDSEYGSRSGSTDPIDPDPIRIRIRIRNPGFSSGQFKKLYQLQLQIYVLVNKHKYVDSGIVVTILFR